VRKNVLLIRDRLRSHRDSVASLDSQGLSIREVRRGEDPLAVADESHPKVLVAEVKSAQGSALQASQAISARKPIHTIILSDVPLRLIESQLLRIPPPLKVLFSPFSDRDAVCAIKSAVRLAGAD
jgi:response regulator RpfG family c-di-GMP phosphodiesterase